MTYDDTQLVTVDCPHEGCQNRCTALIPDGTAVVECTTGNDDDPHAAGKVRIDCPDHHQFYVHFGE